MRKEWTYENRNSQEIQEQFQNDINEVTKVIRDLSPNAKYETEKNAFFASVWTDIPAPLANTIPGCNTFERHVVIEVKADGNIEVMPYGDGGRGSQHGYRAKSPSQVRSYLAEEMIDAQNHPEWYKLEAYKAYNAAHPSTYRPG